MSDFFQNLLYPDGKPTPKYRYAIYEKGGEYHILVWYGLVPLKVSRTDSPTWSVAVAESIAKSIISQHHGARMKKKAPYVLVKSETL